MSVPDFQSLMLPILKLLADGREWTTRELICEISDQFSLTEADKEERLPSGASKLIDNRVGWAKTHMKNAGLVENPNRGKLKLSTLGRSVLERNPARIDMKFLREFDGYREFIGELDEAAKKADEQSRANPELDSTPLELLEMSFTTLQVALVDELRERLNSCSPQFFESIVLKLLRAMGYGGAYGEGKVTAYSRDGGLDGVISEDKLGLDVECVQAKRWEGNVGRPVIQSFVGSMDMIRAKKGVVVTTAEFSRDAHEFVDRIEGKKVVLISGKQLAQLMVEHGVGVAVSKSYELKEVSNDFFDE